MSLAMTRAERESFLAEVHVGVISIEEPGRGPLSVPIWYAYPPGGELWLVTDRDSRKGRESRGGSIRVSLRPERWLSVDYSKEP
jgi:nitroimidazol reductase NimA-like FMN-containing flavoprotein (pyridoxamine 5'-phosphate oxidase superfamily)